VHRVTRAMLRSRCVRHAGACASGLSSSAGATSAPCGQRQGALESSHLDSAIIFEGARQYNEERRGPA
jgi:hypothetical protein